jgi:hypothetical protein
LGPEEGKVKSPRDLGKKLHVSGCSNSAVTPAFNQVDVQQLTIVDVAAWAMQALHLVLEVDEGA